VGSEASLFTAVPVHIPTGTNCASGMNRSRSATNNTRALLTLQCRDSHISSVPLNSFHANMKCSHYPTEAGRQLGPSSRCNFGLGEHRNNMTTGLHVINYVELDLTKRMRRYCRQNRYHKLRFVSLDQPTSPLEANSVAFSITRRSGITYPPTYRPTYLPTNSLYGAEHYSRGQQL
jgi:hypothetical protein